ncbi:MAG: hypothetical protein QOE70_5036 [Chthoniobacter sp.]|jgi:hypothetical protein|nr:hypothetical protein [Chthoniobacter sp.]
MKNLQLTAFAAALAAGISFQPTLVMAQDAPKPGNTQGGQGGRGNRGGTPEEFRQRMAERLKTSLKATDEDWSVIQPLLEKVTTKQREAMGSRFGGGGPGGPGGGGGRQRGGGDAAAPATGGDQAARPGSAQSTALREALENESTSPDQLKAKMAAVREQRKKSNAELATAREELSKVLTVRQEAVLVSAGILE